MNQELELYKLCCPEDSLVDEMGWVNEREFCVWVPYYNVSDFIDGMKRIFGYGLFDDGGFDANMQENWICIDLAKAIGDCLDVGKVFPRDKYEH